MTENLTLGVALVVAAGNVICVVMGALTVWRLIEELRLDRRHRQYIAELVAQSNLYQVTRQAASLRAVHEQIRRAWPTQTPPKRQRSVTRSTSGTTRGGA